MAGKIIYGVNAVREALLAGHSVNRVWLAKESRAHGYQQVIDEARAGKVPFQFVPQAKLNELTGTREHQGVAAAISPVAYMELAAFLEGLPARATVLVLDQVQHPKNVGLLVRTAAASGAAGVLMPVRGGALVDDTVLRASAGTALRLPLVAVNNVAQALRALRDAGFWSYALDARGAEDLFTVDWPARTALVVGNETAGVRPGVRKSCDGAAAIPMAEGIESLNAAVAAGVALFQVAQQRRAMGDAPAP
jgi:23S rRNA (guanosine2251-2'-O)-methyltransferase